MNEEHLKAALVDPASYTHPFKMNSAFFGMETISCRMGCLPPDRHKTLGFVFLSEKAREVVQALLAQHIGAHVMIVAPKELAAGALRLDGGGLILLRQWHQQLCHRPIPIPAVAVLAPQAVLLHRAERVAWRGCGCRRVPAC